MIPFVLWDLICPVGQQEFGDVNVLVLQNSCIHSTTVMSVPVYVFKLPSVTLSVGPRPRVVLGRETWAQHVKAHQLAQEFLEQQVWPYFHIPGPETKT